MVRAMRKLIVMLVLAIASCGPGSRNPGMGSGSGSGSGNPDCPTCATVSGRVWAPKWAPGDVPAGQEIPIFGAMVYVSSTKPDPIPQKVYCEACIDAPQGGVMSSHDGSFSLDVLPGHYWLVIQKGQFRSEQEIDLVTGPMPLTSAQTTLPEKNDPQNGAWIPKIAIAYGNYDAVGDILAKIGIGTLATNKDPITSGVDNGDSTSEITFYSYSATGAGSVANLVQNLTEMEKYHIIFFPCSTEVDDTLFAQQTVLTNIRKYVAEGGKIYVTDWSGEIADRAFPPQLQLGDGGFSGDPIDSVGEYDPTALTGTLTTAGTADGDLYDAADGAVADTDLATWLGMQIGPDEDDPTPHLLKPDRFTVVDNWNWIAKLTSHVKGNDMNGMPVYDDPKAWVTGSDGTHGVHPLSVTYEPAGCGKVLYSTFQTSGADASEMHQGLMPQERVLLFLIMEIGACTENPVIF
jgi:hypothetical protein